MTSFRLLDFALAGSSDDHKPVVIHGINDDGEAVTVHITAEQLFDIQGNLERLSAALCGEALPQRQAGPPQPGRPFRVICGGNVY